MGEDEFLIGNLLDEACLTVEELARACAVSVDWIERQVAEGALPAPAESVVAWRFSSCDLRRARRLRDLERYFEAPPELAALVADMIEEMEMLRARLRRAGID